MKTAELAAQLLDQSKKGDIDMETAELAAKLQEQSETEIQIGKQETQIFKQDIHKDQRKEKSSLLHSCTIHLKQEIQIWKQELQIG